MKSHQEKVADGKSKGGAAKNIINAGSIKLVIAGTGCENAERVEQVINCSICMRKYVCLYANVYIYMPFPIGLPYVNYQFLV